MEGFVSEGEEPLPENRDFVPSKVFLVSRREEERKFNSVVYVREDLVQFENKVMNEFWSRNYKSILYVRGPPGCGKTCFFHLWARLRSIEERKSVLLLQFRDNGTSRIWIREADGNLWLMQEAIEKDHLKAKTDKILNDRKKAGRQFDICIHDGVLHGNDLCKSMLSKLNTAIVNGIIKRVVHVTSLSFSLSTGGQTLDSSGPIVQLSLDSWRLQDYKDAIACPDFTNQMTGEGTKLWNDRTTLEKENTALEKEKSDPDDAPGSDGGSGDTGDSVVAEETAPDAPSWTDVIEKKYFFAGGSARFMFDYLLSELRDFLDSRFDMVPESDWFHFAQEVVAPSTPHAVNTLMQQFKRKASPVSKYVLFRAYDKCKTELVNSVKAVAHASDNPTLKGWAFELEQIDLIRLTLESQAAHPEHVTNRKGLSFRPVSSIEYDEKKLEHRGTINREGTIIWCTKWNQGCFDVAFYQETTLVTLQFTVSEEHSLKPNYIRKLRDELSKKGVTLDKHIHVGLGDASQFQFRLDSTGTGRQHSTDHPEFTISAYHSPPLQKVVGTPGFQAEFDSAALLTVDMWELGNKRTKKS